MAASGIDADGLCAVVLAAGKGTRLRPLTLDTPKALCPVNNRPLLDLALESVRPYVRDIAVNVHYLAATVRQHLAGTPVHVSDEEDALLGSAGALGHLHDWIDGRAVLVRNSDAYLTGDLGELMAGWDGTRPRLLGRRSAGPSDFGDIEYVGACLLPAAAVATLPDARAALFDLIWQPAWAAGQMEFAMLNGEFVDCGTPADYLRANMIASGGASVIGAGARVDGTIDRVVVWPGGYVGPGERLADCIRIGTHQTIRG